MKPKVFRDVYWVVFLIFELFFAPLFLLPPACSGYILYTYITDPTQMSANSMPQFVLFMSVCIAMTIGGIWMLNHNLFLPRAFGRLLVYEDRVVYKCLLRKTRVLRFEECEYIGVENFDKLNRGLPVVRGDETSFIYFSKNPFPQKYVGKVTTLKNSKDFIKITYTDKLAKALIDILPAEKDNLLRSFYAKMQAADRELNANKKSKKSKKK